MSHKAHIARITNLRPHPNADRLMLTTLFGNQVVVGLNTRIDDVIVYFDGEIQLSEEYANVNDLIARTNEKGEHLGGYFGKNRRVRTQKFRGEKSDGYVADITSLDYTGYKISTLKDGDEFDELNGHKICNKYLTPKSQNMRIANQKTRKIIKMFPEHFDTEQLGYHIEEIPVGSLITMSFKLHGTSGRIGNVLIEDDRNPLFRLINRIKPNTLTRWAYINGTRRVVTGEAALDGYYGGNNFRENVLKILKGNLKKGEVVYYEIVGWLDGTSTSIMPAHDVTKAKDKEVEKLYGKTIVYKYGCPVGTSDFYVYRMTMNNQDGQVTEYSWDQVKTRCNELGIKHVPEVTRFIYSGNSNALMELVDSYLDKPSVLDSSHVEEGVCVRVENTGFYQIYKSKSYLFKVLEGIIKEKEDVVDIEESQ